MKQYSLIVLIIISFLLERCGSYTITKNSFVDQLEKHQDVEEVLHWTPIGYSKYPSNRMEKVVCKNSEGKYVYLYPDKNTTVEIFSKSNEDVFNAYFDTVIYKDGKLYGLRSRIIGGVQEISVDDIDKIEFHAELPNTEELSQDEIEQLIENHE
jgi:hypothetical protein